MHCVHRMPDCDWSSLVSDISPRKRDRVRCAQCWLTLRAQTVPGDLEHFGVASEGYAVLTWADLA